MGLAAPVSDERTGVEPDRGFVEHQDQPRGAAGEDRQAGCCEASVDVDALSLRGRQSLECGAGSFT
jgi:hypothetical protein